MASSLSQSQGGTLLSQRKRACSLRADQDARRFEFEAIATDFAPEPDFGPGGGRPGAETLLRFREDWVPDSAMLDEVKNGAQVYVETRKAWLQIVQVYEDTDDGWHKCRLNMIG